MENLSAILIAAISSGLITTIITRVFAAIDKKQEAKSGQTAALRLLMKDRLRFLCERYIDKGFIYSDELDDVLEFHRIYHDVLKGNGYLDTLIENVKRLPVHGQKH